MLAATSQKRKIGTMWTRFEEGQRFTVAGGWDTSQEIVEENTEAGDIPKKGKRRNAQERKVQASLEDTSEEIQENRQDGDTNGQCWTSGKVVHKSSACRWEVAYVGEEQPKQRRTTCTRIR